MEEATIARDYTWPVKITTFDAGQDQRLTPAGQLRLQQEIGELHMRTGGLGYEALCDAGMASIARPSSMRRWPCAPGTGAPAARSFTAATNFWTQRGRSSSKA